MNTYIPQLLVDIRNAHCHQPEDNESDELTTFEQEMEAIENYATGNNIPASLSQQCGLTVEQFPPENKLTEGEIQTIIIAFQEMLNTWHIIADLPIGIPASKAYPLLIGLLKEEAWYFSGGMLHFDFCTGYAPDCELQEYCPCLKYWNEKESKTVRMKDNLNENK